MEVDNMQFTVKLANDQEITCIGYKKYEERIQGADRKVLELWIDAEGKTFDEVDALFTAENTSRIENGADTEELVYENYVIRAGIALMPKESGEGERYEVKLAQLTYVEEQLTQHAKDIAALYYLQMSGGAAQ